MRYLRSMRWRLQAWYGLLLLLLLVGFGLSAYQIDKSMLYGRLDEELRLGLAFTKLFVNAKLDGGFRQSSESSRFREGILMPPRPGNSLSMMASRIEARLRRKQPFAAVENPLYFAIWGSRGELLASSTLLPGTACAPPHLKPYDLQRFRDEGIHRETFQFLEDGSCLMVGRSTQRERSDLAGFAGLLVVVGSGVFLVGILGGGWIVTRAVAPIHQISDAAMEISEGELGRRIAVDDTHSELGKLAGVLNHCFMRLEETFERQRQFTSDASHELRTPLTVMLMTIQSALRRSRSVDEYRDSLETCLRSAQHMKRLTESLLELARLDHETKGNSEAEMGTVVHSSVEMLQSLAEDKGVALIKAIEPVADRVDLLKMEQVVVNLVSNAIQYSDPGSNVLVGLSKVDDRMILFVKDQGKGIAPEDLPRLFDRFYRCDKSRTRRNGHSGLGLAITKAVVDSMKGVISVESRRGEGSLFRVELPSAGGPPVADSCEPFVMRSNSGQSLSA